MCDTKESRKLIRCDVVSGGKEEGSLGMGRLQIVIF